MDEKEFYKKRDMRTSEYIGGQKNFTREIYISASDEIYQTQVGQVFLITLINLLCRVHRCVKYNESEKSSNKLLISSLFGNETLNDELAQIAEGCNPYINFSQKMQPSDDAIVIGVGKTPPHKANFYVGVDRSIAFVSEKSEIFNDAVSGSLRGACLAACLGAAQVFKIDIGIPVKKNIKISIWNLKEDHLAEYGPNEINIINLKNVLMLGAGAVGSCLAYWCKIFGSEGRWDIIDGDFVKIHNLNRSLLFFAQDSDFFQNQKQKAVAIEKHIPHMVATTAYFHEVNIQFGLKKYDVVLCLANEFNIRKDVNFIKAGMFLQATTGTNWLAQLHRHIPLKDDCVFCRNGELMPVAMQCSVQTVQIESKSTDMALPFLSAISSLMLAVQLQKISEGQVELGDTNDWRFDLKSEHKILSASIRSCRDTCDVKELYLKIKKLPHEKDVSL